MRRTLLAASACTAGWEGQEIPTPPGAPAVVYERRPFSAVRFVGTEQRRRLRVADRVVSLPVQPSVAFVDGVYLSAGPRGYRLSFAEEHVEVTVHLDSLIVRETKPKDPGVFIGTLSGDEGKLEFRPAP